MTTKIVRVALILLTVTAAYLFIIIVIPLLADFASTANTTIGASSNMSNYPGLSGAILGAPLFLYFVPAIIGIVLIIIVLRAPETP